jgi:hypothetical protein
MPESETGVECAAQYELSVGRVLDRGHGGVSLGIDGFEALPRGRVPDAHESVVAARDDAGAVPVKVDARDGVRVGGERGDAVAAANVP